MQLKKFVTLHSALGPLAEYYVLYPVFTVLMLGLIWSSTWNLISVKRAGIENESEVLGRELVETYESQVVRALREIDQVLKLVKYSYESQGGKIDFADLKSRSLLPPDMLFMVSIEDRNGQVVASSRPVGYGHTIKHDDIGRLRQNDMIEVSRPWKSEKSNEWLLCFSRRVNAADGAFDGVVMVTVDANYFVSGYDASKLGEHGVLGLLGTDGVFRVRRTGEAVSAGDSVDFSAMEPNGDIKDMLSAPLANPWDGVWRHTFARQLYDFPLAVIVGLSEDDHQEASNRIRREYLWRAASGSALLILVITLLWRNSRLLALAHQREAEARVAYAERVEYLAYHDGLTGLPNRSLFTKLLDQSISQARRHNRQLAVLFLDLDHFKQVNDTLGHDAGDELLKEVAVRLKSCLRESDTVARLGGDEFVVLIPELEDETYVATVARKMLVVIASPFTLIEQEFRVTVSIGIGVYPQDGEDEQTLKKNADIAMYRAKEGGKNNFRFYSGKLNANSFGGAAQE